MKYNALVGILMEYTRKQKWQRYACLYTGLNQRIALRTGAAIRLQRRRNQQNLSKRQQDMH